MPAPVRGAVVVDVGAAAAAGSGAMDGDGTFHQHSRIT
jgi:hypothetical protein